MADQIVLTLPDRSAFADVAAETAATIALRVGFSGAQVDRLRDEVSSAFVRTVGTAEGAGASVVVEYDIGAEGVTVQIGERTGIVVHLKRRGPD
ncbi:MAG: hypothetical protein ACRD29_04125 [Acidimicrobiales bacterium]